MMTQREQSGGASSASGTIANGTGHPRWSGGVRTDISAARVTLLLPASASRNLPGPLYFIRGP